MKTARTLLLFSLISLTPVPLLIFATGFGGAFAGKLVWLALGYMTLLALVADRGIRAITPALPPDANSLVANLLSLVLAVSHFGLLALVVNAVAGGTELSAVSRVALFFSAGLFFGQVSNSNAHELIHRQNRFLRWSGIAVYCSLLFGHHASAHTKIHHRYVATDLDPNSARAGEGFYRFALRAWVGSFRAGYRAEKLTGSTPYPAYLALAALTVALAFWGGGASGAAALLALASYAQTQLLLSDYVQHYGLHRSKLPDGKYEPIAAAHSWNSRHWFTSFLMLNAPRHSDHHAHPARPYPSLRLPDQGEAPMLPHSLPMMAAIALFPPLWRRVMRRELALWQASR